MVVNYLSCTGLEPAASRLEVSRAIQLRQHDKASQ